MAKMADGTPLLSAGTLRVLADKLYEKRKNAAREVRLFSCNFLCSTRNSSEERERRYY